MSVKQELSDADYLAGLALPGGIIGDPHSAPAETGSGHTAAGITPPLAADGGLTAAAGGHGTHGDAAASAGPDGLEGVGGGEGLMPKGPGRRGPATRGAASGCNANLGDFDTWLADPELVASVASACKSVQWVEADFTNDIVHGDAAGADALGDVDWASLPLNETSLAGKLPSGGVCISMTRIRGTINDYVAKTCMMNWFATFKVGTVQALHRRLVAHAPNILGKMDVDVQIGFRQLRLRVTSVLCLHRALRSWLELHEDEHLVATILPARELLKYHRVSGDAFACDLKLVLLYARFHFDLRDTKSVCSAVRKINAALLQELAKSCMASADMLSDDAGFKDADEPDGSVATTGPGKAEGKAPKRRRIMALRLSTKLSFSNSATAHLAKLISDGVKFYLYRIPSTFAQDDKAANQVADELWDLSDLWVDLVDSLEGNDDERKFGATLKAVATVFTCCVPAEGDKPPAMQVRAARKTILDGVAMSGSIGEEVSKAVVSFEAGQTAMASARSHAAAGLEDSAADAAFTSSIKVFEDRFSGAFDDIDAWLDTGNNGHMHDMFSVGQELPAIVAMASCMTCCISRWSPASLTAHMDDMIMATANCVEILYACCFVMYRECHEQLCPLLSMPLSTSSGGTITPGADESKEDRPAAKAEPDSPERPPRGDVGVADAGGVTATDALKALVKDSALLTSKVTKLMDDCRGASNALLNVFDEVAKRVGGAMDPYADEVGSLRELITTLDGNKLNMLRVFEYCGKCAEMVLDGWADAPLMCTHPRIEDIMVHLLPLARLRDAFDKANPEFRCGGMVAELQPLAEFGATVLGFLDGDGRALYAKIASKFLDANVGRISTNLMTISSVHMTIMQETEIDKLVGLVTLTPGLQCLVEMASGMSEGNDVGAAMKTWTHNNILRWLDDFVVASGVVQLSVPGAAARGSSATTTTNEMPSADAMCLLRVLCQVLDVGILAALVHTTLLEPAGKGKQIDGVVVFGSATAIVAAYQESLAKLDGLMDSDTVLALEMSVVFSACPFDLVRSWRGCMSYIGGVAQTTLLRQGIRLLGTAIERSKAACPSWEAAFEGGEMNMTVATKVLKNKLKLVSESHNVLHRTLTSMNTMAKTLQLVPRLQDHDETSESIAVAIACLGRSSQASIAIMAVELLTDSGRDPAAPQKAAQFLKTYKTDKAKDLPAALWRELQNMSEVAARDAAPLGLQDALAVAKLRKAGSSGALSSTSAGSPAKSVGAVSSSLSTPSKAASVKSEEAEAASASPAAAASTPGSGPRTLKRMAMTST